VGHGLEGTLTLNQYPKRESTKRTPFSASIRASPDIPKPSHEKRRLHKAAVSLCRLIDHNITARITEWRNPLDVYADRARAC
jgi:hypothetical protein